MTVAGPGHRSNAFLTWILFVGLTLLAGSASSIFGWARPGAWYQGLAKPVATPPDITFAIVWPILFVLMGTGAFLVWRNLVASVRQKRQAMEAYVLQLALNIAWPVVFFSFHMMGVAIGVLVALLGMALLTTSRFWSIRPLAGIIMLPYLLWICFALYLNVGFWMAQG